MSDAVRSIVHTAVMKSEVFTSRTAARTQTGTPGGAWLHSHVAIDWFVHCCAPPLFDTSHGSAPKHKVKAEATCEILRLRELGVVRMLKRIHFMARKSGHLTIITTGHSVPQLTPLIRPLVITASSLLERLCTRFGIVFEAICKHSVRRAFVRSGTGAG